MYRIAKEFSFPMGHRLTHHKGLCQNYHGHNYKIIIGLKSKYLNLNGMIMDFSELKEIAKHYFKNLDHAMMINRADTDKFMKLQIEMPFLKVVVVDYEPTAENMAKSMFDYFNSEVKKYVGDIEVDYITIYETDTSQATYSEE